MQAIVEYWDRVSYTSCNSEVKREEVLEGTEEEIFKEYYARNNRLRYCNGSYYQFKEKGMYERYMNWYRGLDKATTFNMYYGTGVID